MRCLRKKEHFGGKRVVFQRVPFKRATFSARTVEVVMHIRFLLTICLRDLRSTFKLIETIIEIDYATFVFHIIPFKRITFNAGRHFTVLFALMVFI